MGKVNPFSALWTVFIGREQSSTNLLDLDEITNENPELVEKLKNARDKAEAKAENRFKAELYKQSKQNSKSIPKGKDKSKAITKKKESQMTIGDE